MPNKEFLEKYPLYKWFYGPFALRLDELPDPAIHMDCKTCESEQTFNAESRYLMAEPELSNAYVGDGVVCAIYVCTSCKKFSRHFIFKFSSGGHHVRKVGQEPPWDISIDRDLERALGEKYTPYYKHGLTCESQSYGIGAFAYYRRIVEEIIDSLLESIEGFLSGTEREEYAKALEEAKKTTVARDKIDFVKGLLPSRLRPGNVNPLSTLHKVLSVGLHMESDERCLELAEEVREALVYLTSLIASDKKASDRYMTAMQKLHGHSKGNAEKEKSSE